MVINMLSDIKLQIISMILLYISPVKVWMYLIVLHH